MPSSLETRIRAPRRSKRYLHGGDDLVPAMYGRYASARRRAVRLLVVFQNGNQRAPTPGRSR
jgi:hypothetical protein